MAKKEFDELRSALTELTATIQAQAGLSNEEISARSQAIEASREAASADREEAAASKSAAQGLGPLGNSFTKLAGSAISTVNAFYGLAKIIAGIGEAGRKYAEQVGTTASQGAQFQLDLIKTLKADTKKFGADQQLTANQIRGAAQSFAETFVGAAEGMRISAEGSANFARSLNQGFKSEFQLTAASMKALITVGAGTTKEFEKFRKASGLAGISSGQFANLVNKNSLSFMLYGPSFAKAAVNAEKLGISLAAVQKAQESMVTNLDGTIDTVAQINQLGGQIDFGTLTTIAETQGPEAVLSYLQSTIPPNLFQSASTRALLTGLGVPIEDLMKRTGSVQETAANQIEKAMTEVAGPASQAAQNIAKLNKDIQALDESKAMELMNAAYGAAMALIGLIGALGGFAIALVQAAGQLLKFPGGLGVATPTGGGAPKIPGGPSDAMKKALELRRQNPNLSAAEALSQAKYGDVPVFKQMNRFMDTSRSPTLRTASGVGNFITQPFGAAKNALISNLGGPQGGAMKFLGASSNLVGRGVGAVGSGIGTSFTRMGAFGVGAGLLSTGMAGADAYRAALASGKGKQEAAGQAAVAGGSAAVGTIVGGMFGPVGAAIGGQLGGFIGKKINEFFPGFGKSIGETLGKMKEAAMPLLEKLKELWATLKGPLFTIFKVIGAVVGGIIVANFKILGFVFTKIIAPVLGVVIKIFKMVIAGWVGIINAIIRGINKVKTFFGGEPISEIPTPAEGGTAETMSVKETAVTSPTGTSGAGKMTPKPIAAEIASTVTSAVTETAQRVVAQGDPELKRAIVDLTKIIKDSQTEIKVDNHVVEVSRLGLKTVQVNTRSA